MESPTHTQLRNEYTKFDIFSVLFVVVKTTFYIHNIDVVFLNFNTSKSKSVSKTIYFRYNNILHHSSGQLFNWYSCLLHVAL